MVTVLFCDVTGSTAMAEQLDPEDWAEIMNDAFEYLTGPVYRYEGTVARLMGDAILAFFGAPTSHEEDPQRAVLAGLDIVSSIGPFRAQIKKEYGFDFNVRVGINTGPVVVGDVGSSQAFEYSAMGDAVNIAARMEQTAQPGTVQIAEATHRLVSPLFDFEELGGIEVKGKGDPVLAYRAIGPKAEPGRLRGIQGLGSTMVGRAKEMDSIREVLAGAEQGAGRIISLMGDAGLGKSRLIDEARQEWEAKGHYWAETRGVAYDMNRPYGMFSSLASKLVGLSDSDTQAEAHAKIVGCFAEFPEDDRDQAIRAVEMLLDHLGDQPPLQGDAFKRELFAAMRGIWRLVTSSGPSVLVLDDLHWADSESAELLLHVLDLVDETPTVFLCAYRPDRQAPSWRIKQQIESDFPHRNTEITLQPLTGEYTDELVNNLLTIADLSDDLRRLILDKTEGNPFFVEEVVRTLIDSGVVVWDEEKDGWRAVEEISAIKIPDNLQALLISRIDRLEGEARRTLQLAAVIGRSFYHKVLEQVSDEAIALDRQLSTLQRVDLIHEAARVPDVEYMFRHELTRQAAYDSILRRRRPEFHQKVAEAIEEMFSDRLEEEAHRLAYHFGQTNDDEKAMRYSVLAGDVAARLYANDEAVKHYTNALRLGEELKTDSGVIADLYTKRGRTMELGNRLEDAMESYEELRNLGIERGDKVLEVAAMIPEGTLLATLNKLSDPAKARDLSQHALELATELEHPRYMSKANWNLMLACFFGAGNNKEQIAYGEEAVSIAREHGLKEELAYALNDINRPYFEAGDTAASLAVLVESGELWRELGNMPMLADNLDAVADMYAFTGQFEEASKYVDQSLEVSRSIGNAWAEAVALFTDLFIQMEKGEFGKAYADSVLADARADVAGFTGMHSFTSSVKALLCSTLGNDEEAEEHAREAADRSSSNPWALAMGLTGTLQVDHYSKENKLTSDEVVQIIADLREASTVRYLQFLFPIATDVLIGRGLFDAALELADSAIKTSAETGVVLGVPDLYLSKAQALIALGREDEAIAILEHAVHVSDEHGQKRMLWRILGLLADFADARGNSEQGSAYRGRAKEIVEHIAANTGSETLTASYLERADVVGILNG